MLYRITLKKIYLDFISNKSKTIECRINNGVFKNIKVGDVIEFYCNSPHNDLMLLISNNICTVKCVVTKINYYSSFLDLLSLENYKLCIPDATSIQHALNVYYSIPMYKENEKLYGVVAFHIVLN